MEKEILEQIKKMTIENKELNRKLNITEIELERIKKMNDILFPMLIGMIVCLYVIIF